MPVDIAAENALPGEDHTFIDIWEAGSTDNLGFARQISVNVGGVVEFSCHGPGTVIDIYRMGWYGGGGWRKITTIANASTQQPDPVEVPGSNGATTCTAWSTTASWQVPAGATSGYYLAMLRRTNPSNASWIPFIVRDDAAAADIIVKASDSTWGLAYNYYGSPASPLTGKSWYGSGGPMGNVTTRSHFATYHKPIITRAGIPQTYWHNAESPLVRFLERNGFRVKYITSRDLDADPGILAKAPIFISSGHDEYWSQPMRDAALAHRARGGHSLFMSGNELFWRIRYDHANAGAWCFKDTAPGPGTHAAGAPLDPVSWTGTWKDTRWADRQPEWEVTGTDFRLNGVNDYDAVISATDMAHPVWAGAPGRDAGVTLTKVIGFEADSVRALRPAASVARLASTSLNIDGKRADDNGQTYENNGALDWGIVAQRYPSGAVSVGFGTVQWAWALHDVHDRHPGTPTSPAAQQMTVNLLQDLGARAHTLMPTLTAQSTDRKSVV